MDIRELKAKITDLSLEKKDLIVRLEIAETRCLDLSEKLIEARKFIVELGNMIADHKDKIMNR